MPFNPSLPAYRTRIVSDELRENFNGLKALIDAQAAQLAALQATVLALGAAQVPVGGVVAWFQDTPGVPALPANFVACNGQVLEDAASPLNGQTMPDINTGARRFLRGALNSGALGGIDYFGLAHADNSGTGPAYSFVTPDFSPGAEPFPPYVTAVFVIRVK